MRHLLFLLTALVFTASAAVADPTHKLPSPPAVLGKANTLQFLVVRYENDVEKEVSQAWLEKPNKVYAEDIDRQRGGMTIVYASDGKTQTEYRKSRGEYTQSPAPKHLELGDTHSLALSALSDFYNSSQFRKFKSGPRDEKVAEYVLPLNKPGSSPLYEVLSVDTQTGLPQSVRITFRKPVTTDDDEDAPKGKKEQKALAQKEERIDFHNWQLDAPIDKSKFVYTPPADAKPSPASPDPADQRHGRARLYGP